MFWYSLYICKGKIYANFILWGFLTSIHLEMSIFEQFLSQIEQKKIFTILIRRHTSLLVFCTDGPLAPRKLLESGNINVL